MGRITFTEADELTDADLAHIGTATGLTVLEIGNKGESLQHVTGKGISALLTPSVRKTLQTMTVYSRLPHVTDEDLLLFENSPAIRGLQFYFGMSGRETFLSRFAARGMKLNNLVLADSGPNRPLPSSWLMSVPDHSPEITALQIANCALTIPDVQSLHRLPQMQTLTLIACGLDDEVFNAIAEMTNLLKLELNGMSYNPHPGITDRGAVRIAEFKSLWHLSFAHTNVGDDTCAAIESLTNLKTLSLGATRVTDKGVSRLCALPVLSSVQLSSCPGISDESLYSLAQIMSLKMLWISSNPQLTEPALRKLQGALPDCKIVCDFPLATELGNK